MKSHRITIGTGARCEMVCVTREIEKLVAQSGVADGFVLVNVPHTTAAVTINENADPSVVRDILYEMDKLVPAEDGYRHVEGNSAAHLKSSLFGVDRFIPIEDGRMVLGTWQGVYFCEFDGPRTRSLIVKIFEG